MDKLHEGGFCPVITLDHLDMLDTQVGGFVFVDLNFGSCSARGVLRIVQDLWLIGALDDIRTRTLRKPVESADLKQRFKDRMKEPRRLLVTGKVTAFGRLLMGLDV